MIVATIPVEKTWLVPSERNAVDRYKLISVMDIETMRKVSARTGHLEKNIVHFGCYLLLFMKILILVK